MLIFYEGFHIEIAKLRYDTCAPYYYNIYTPGKGFHFWDYCQPEFDNLSNCLKASMNACLQIIQDYGFGPDFMETDDSWLYDCGAYDASSFQ